MLNVMKKGAMLLLAVMMTVTMMPWAMGAAGTSYAKADTPKIEYDTQEDTEILLEDYVHVSKTLDGYIYYDEDDPEDFPCEVTDVKVKSQKPEKAGLEVVDLTWIEDDEDGDDWWKIEGVNYGEAVIQVSYKDKDDNDANYEFTIRVVHRSYDVTIALDGSSDKALPGGKISLKADAHMPFME